MANRNHHDCCIAILINGVLHRTWSPRASDGKALGKALAKQSGIEAVAVLQDRMVRQADGLYRWETVTHFAAGADLSGLL